MEILSDQQAERIAALYQYQILDTQPEDTFDNLTRLAAQVCETPIALIGFVDQQRQWFKSKIGWEVGEISPHIAFCNQTIEQGNPLVVPDALADQRFATNPLVTDPPHIRFYAGIPLIIQGHALGTLCVIDSVPRQLNPQQLKGLQVLGSQVVAQLESHRNLVNLTRANIERQQAEKLLRQQTQRERLVTEIAYRIRQSLDINTVLRTTVLEVQQFLVCDRVFILRFEPDRSGVVVVESGSNNWKSILGSCLKDPDWADCIRYRQGQIQAITDIQAEDLTQPYINFLAQFQIRANLVAPIWLEEKLWGLLVANHCVSPRQWQQLEIDLFEQLATQLAIALQQSQLYQQTQYQLRREQALNRVIQTVRNSLDLQTVFSTAVFEIAQLLQAPQAHIVQYLPQRQLWLNVANYRATPDLPDALGMEIPDAGNEVAAQLKRLEVVWINDANTCTDEINSNYAQTFPGAWLLVPLHFGGVVWGSLGLVRNKPQSAWRQDEVELTRAIADQLAMAIQQSILFEQVQTQLAERQRAEESLRQSEATLRSFYDSAPMMMGIVELVDDDIRHISDNAVTAKFFGLTPAAMANRLASEMGVPKTYIREWMEHYREAERRREPVHFIYPHDTAQGERWLMNTVSAIEGAGSSYPRFAYVVEDITERQRSQQQINEQAALIDITTDAMIVRNLDNQILFWNQAAEHLYGWRVEEVVGKKANKFLGKGSAQIEAVIKAVIENSQWQGELHKVTKAGSEIVVESRWILMRNRAGKPKSILTVDTDITEKKQLQTQLLRTQRLESLGTLARGMAHELNNVLAPILMSVQLLEMRLSDERSLQLLKMLETNVKRGATFIKQVLAFVRGIEGERTVLQIQYLISEIEQIAKQTFPQSINFFTDIAPDLWTVSANADQLHQVLMNLIANARDAMPDGGSLKISAANVSIDDHCAQIGREASLGNYVSITVSDTGGGISSEIIERIFEPFFTTKEVGQGIGLGLSTAIGIVKSYGGFIDVSSTVGEGAQFQVFLPAVSVVVENQSDSALELPRGNGELVLVVDDEASIREVTKATLETHNYKVITASDGIEALAVYAQHKHKINVVVLDMMMPQIDGLTIIGRLQKIAPFMKIIAVSGLIQSKQVDSASNVKAFLSKPYTMLELLRTIHLVLTAFK